MSAKSRQRATAAKLNRHRRAIANGPIEPVVITSDAPDVEPIHIFTIDDVPYYMPGYISPALALRMLEVIEDKGEEAGLSYALREVLGDGGHDALKNAEGITSEQFSAVMDIVLTRILATMDAGNS